MEKDMDRSNKYVAELKDMEGSPCIVCPEGRLEVSTFTKTMERDGTTLVVKEVPALVCDTCGDVGYTEAIGRRLDEMHKAARTAKVDMAIRSFEKKATA
jgi:YgiT-type zinc finger domain-containing protein